MRQRQQRFLSINRIIVLLYGPLSVALGVFYLFTGDLLRAVLSLCALLWLCLPNVLYRVFHIRPSQLLHTFYLIFLLLGYTGGLVLMLSQRSQLYDLLVHLQGGFFCSLLAAAVFCSFTQQRSIKKDLGFSNLFCFCFSLVAGMFGEILQFAFTFWMMNATFVVMDTVWDFIECLAGVVLYCILTALYVHKNIHTYPLYSFEDFAALNIKSSISIITK